MAGSSRASIFLSRALVSVRVKSSSNCLSSTCGAERAGFVSGLAHRRGCVDLNVGPSYRPSLSFCACASPQMKQIWAQGCAPCHCAHPSHTPAPTPKGTRTHAHTHTHTHVHPCPRPHPPSHPPRWYRTGYARRSQRACARRCSPLLSRRGPGPPQVAQRPSSPSAGASHAQVVSSAYMLPLL